MAHVIVHPYPWLFINITNARLACDYYSAHAFTLVTQKHIHTDRRRDRPIPEYMLNIIKGIKFSVVKHLVFMIVFDVWKCARQQTGHQFAKHIVSLAMQNTQRAPTVNLLMVTCTLFAIAPIFYSQSKELRVIVTDDVCTIATILYTSIWVIYACSHTNMVAHI